MSGLALRIDERAVGQRAVGLIVIGVLTAGALALMGIWVAAAALLAAVSACILVRQPASAIYLFTFLLYTNAPVVASRFHGVPSSVGAAAAGLLLIPLVCQWVFRREFLAVTPAVPWIAGLVAFRILALVWAPDRALALDAVVSTLAEGFILFLLLTSVIRDEVTLRRVMWTAVIAGGLLGTLSITQQLAPGGHMTFGGFAQTSLDEKILDLGGAPRDARSAGPIGEKNYYAQFMLFLVPIAIGLIRCETINRLRQIVAVVLLTLIAMGIAATASRGAAVGFVTVIGVLLFLREVRLRSVAWIVIASISLVLLFPAYRERLHSMLVAVEVLPGGGEIQTVEKSLQGRISEMSAAAIIFSNNPIGGVGPGNFPPEFLKQAGALGFQVHAEQRMAHCSYLEIAAETGIIGLVLYLSILVVIGRSLWIARNQASTRTQYHLATAMLLVIVALATTGLFLSFAFERYYWFVLALAAATARVTQIDSVRSPDLERNVGFETGAET